MLENQIAFTASDNAWSAIASLGRTEDVMFSPDNRRLAFASFNAGTCVFIDVEMDSSTRRKTIALSGVVAIASPGLRHPHGLAFLDSETLIVADRKGTVPVIKIPPRGSEERNVTVPVQPVDEAAAFRKIRSPGAVAVIARGRDRYDILVCNSYANRVTRHALDGRARLRVARNRVLLESGLRVPDAMAVSPCERWIAVSNHDTSSVLIFRNTWLLNRRSPPVGTLRGVSYPHGVRFAADGRFIVVADAGEPFVRVYSSADGDWRGSRDPATSMRVMSDEAYLRGRANPQEGGPKGIDIDRDMKVLVTTCEEVPLAFFDLEPVLIH